MKAFAVCSLENPDCAFVVKVENDADYEKAKELALEGYYNWHDVENHPELEQAGYVEGVIALLNEAGIKHEIDDYWDEIEVIGDDVEFTNAVWEHWFSNYEDVSPKQEYLDTEVIE